LSRSASSSSLVLARFLKDWLPPLVKESEDSGRESVQATAWLVGLSTALIALIAANLRVAQLVGTRLLPYLFACLLGVVLFGVVHRLAYQFFELWQRRQMVDVNVGVMKHLVEADTPWEPQELTSVEEVVAELKTYFALDYSFLLSAHSDLASAREAYKTQYEYWKNQEAARDGEIRALLTALAGRSRQDEASILGQSDKGLETMRRRARMVKAAGLVAMLSHGLAALLFLAAITMVAMSLLRRGIGY
jgi:hypothetical protein